jgi:CxxC motif-containing protein
MEINEKKPMTCIICPMGCQLEVTRISVLDESPVYSVTGNACIRGEQYAKKELTNPTRTFTCTVAVTGGIRRLVAAKSKIEVPRDLQLECMQIIRRLSVKAPVHAGDVLCEDILNTGADIIACDDVEAN